MPVHQPLARDGKVYSSSHAPWWLVPGGKPQPSSSRAAGYPKLPRVHFSDFFDPPVFQPRFHPPLFSCPVSTETLSTPPPAFNQLFQPRPVFSPGFHGMGGFIFHVSQPPTFFMVLTPFSRFLARFQPKLFQPRPGHVFTRCCLGFHGMGGSTFSCESTTNVFHGFNPVFTFFARMFETLSTPPFFHATRFHVFPGFHGHQRRINVFIFMPNVFVSWFSPRFHVSPAFNHQRFSWFSPRFQSFNPARPCFHSLLPRFSWHGRINVFV
ncbi:hypothetical protein Fmac_028176 [Flemingia macrophylla]|uniref:Uncharacterized protein n=1 Tax=Flemingia macrophylla TaxID=520843 RepID=A0ABD1L6R3_9FABA